MIKAIATDSIDKWLRRLGAGAVVYVPQERRGGGVVLEPVDKGKRAAHYRRLAESPKRIFLPQIDDLVRFEGSRGKPVLDRTERILFGLRPCDAAAVTILDEFFRRDYPDPNYAARRDHLRLIVVACAESDENCFCVSAATGPVAVDGYDVQLVGLGDVHLAMTGTEEGEGMIARGGELFTDPPASAEERMAEFRRKSEASQEVHLDLQRARKIINDHAEPADFWDHVAQRCLMCGGCAYACPTCTCFNITDRPDSQAQGVRQRLWDTCVLAGFTREASGHNPRQHQPQRCAHRYLHKLGGSGTLKQPFRCVGCGRCAESCITRLGIICVLKELLEQTEARR